MKVFKNLMGDGSKINASEIMVKPNKNLVDSLVRIDSAQLSANAVRKHELEIRSVYLLVMGVATNGPSGIGIFFINHFSPNYRYIYTINQGNYFNVLFNSHDELEVSGTASYHYGLIKL